jgi:PAS domain-containing protein
MDTLAHVPVPQGFADPFEKPGLPVWDVAHLRLAIAAAGVALWTWNVDTNRFTMDERAFELWGVPLSEYVTFDDLSAHIHPADRDRVRSAFSATRALVGAYETDFRIMVGDEVRWVSARGQGNDAGIVGRVMHGIFIEVTGRKQAEEAHDLLAGEMLLNRGMTVQLGGSINFDWSAEGVIVSLQISRNRLDS